VFVTLLGGKTLCIPFVVQPTVLQLKGRLRDICGIPEAEQRISGPCRDLSNPLQYIDRSCGNLRLSLRLAGGKGGFGALLRGAGAKAGAKRVSNYDDCRDLSGRRIRHVKNEKKMDEWVMTEAERQQQAAEIRRKQKEDEEAKNEFKFDSSKYVGELREINDSIQMSVEEALKNSKKTKKRELETPEYPAPVAKKQTTKKRNNLWGEFDLEFEEEEKEGSSKKGQTERVEANESSPVANPQQVAAELVSKEEPFDLNTCASAEELEKLGMERLKVELQKLGLLCGGTLQERAQRLFSVKGKSIDQIDSKIFAKKKDKKSK